MQYVATHIGLAQPNAAYGSEWQPTWACSAECRELQRVAPHIGLALLNGRDGQHVATSQWAYSAEWREWQ